MPRSPFVLLALCLVTSASARSQSNPPRGGAALHAGATWSGLVDQNASALRYQGPGASLGGGWRGIYDRSRIELSLAASKSTLRSRITTDNLNRESSLHVELRLAVLRRVAVGRGSNLSYFAGGQLLLAALGRRHTFPFGAKENFADGFGALSAAGMWEYRRTSGTVLSGSVALPVLSVAARTPYYGLKATPEPRIYGPLSFTAVTHTLRMEKPFASRSTLLVDYRTTLLRDDHPRSLRRIEHSIGTGLELRRRTPQ